MFDEHLPLFVAVACATLLGAAILGLSALLGPRRPSPIKAQAFEGGNPPSGPARDPFHARFYLVAILFLVFDVEAVFIYPWAVTFSSSNRGAEADLSPGVALLEVLAFAGVILVGLVYAWRKGALDWGPRPRVARRDEP